MFWPAIQLLRKILAQGQTYFPAPGHKGSALETYFSPPPGGDD